MSEASLRWWETRRYALAAVLLSALPLLWPAIPPLVDAPGHIGRYHVALAIGHSPALQAHWSYHWRLIGNLGVDLLVMPLGALLGAELAAKLVILAIPPLTIAGMIWLSREAQGRLSPLAALAFPLAYAFPFQMGFVNFALAAALALLALAGWIRLGRQDRLVLRAVLFVPISCALWLAHSFGWGMFGLFAFVVELWRRRTAGEPWPRTILLAVACCIPLALPAVAMATGGASGDGGLGIVWEPVAKLVWLASLLRERWSWYDAVSAVYLYIVLWTAAWKPEYRFAPLTGVLALVALGLFIALPRLLLGGAYVDMRMLPVAIALGLLAIRVAPGHEAIAGRLAVLANGFFLVRTLGTTLAFLLFAQGQQRALEAVPQLPRGSVVLVLVNEACANNWHSDRLGHIAAIGIARREIFENGEWLLDGQQLLKTRLTNIAPYDRDPSQLVYPAYCEAHPTNFHHAIRDFNRQVFDTVWTIGFPTRARLADDVTLRWSNGTSSLYTVAHRR